jgi:hypothetical protein
MGPSIFERLNVETVVYDTPEWRWFEDETEAETQERQRAIMSMAEQVYTITENNKRYRYAFEVMGSAPSDKSLKVWAETYLRGDHEIAHGHIWCQRDTDAVMIRLAHGETVRRQTEAD